VEQLREHLSSELRRYMSPVTLPTVVAQNEESDGATETPLRTGAPMSADGEADSELERPL